MGQFIKKQFIDVIQWPEPDPNLLMWRFPMADEEIQNGAVLTVREAQAALFVDEGKAADVFGPGRHKLTTQTLPLLTNLKNWDKLFQSPFKSDVYFFNTRLQMGRRWGTSQPVTVRDADFGMVSLRSFGMYSYRVADPQRFFTQVSGVTGAYRGEDMETQLRNLSVTQLATAFGTGGVPFLDMAANQMLLSQKMTELLAPAFADLGLALDSFTVESVTLPDALQQKLEERMSMNMVGDLNEYTRYQTAVSIPLAAQNEGGVAGIGAGFAAGQVMAGAMAQSMVGAQQAPAAAVPAAAAGAAVGTAAAAGGAAPADPAQKLAQLKNLLDQGLIAAEDYEQAKAEVLKQLIG
nr:SPFH domain-containing protein [Neisseria sp. HSC-16F19]